MVKQIWKDAVTFAAYQSGISRLARARYGGAGTIFSLHSVLPDASANERIDALRFPVSKLRWFMNWLTREGVDFVSMDDVPKRLSEPSSRPFVAFTFDDGYADNLTVALPVFEEFDAPFTVYVTSGLVERSVDAWWFGLSGLIARETVLELPGLGRFECADLQSKRRAFHAIERAVHEDYAKLPGLLAAIRTSGVNYADIVDGEILTAEQLVRFAEHPLVTIGAHSVTHRNLQHCSIEELRSELQTSRKVLESMIGKPVRHFAYPFGNVRAAGEREASVACELGFETAVTTRHSALFVSHLREPHLLPRIGLWAQDTRSMLASKYHGLYQAYQTRLGGRLASYS